MLKRSRKVFDYFLNMYDYEYYCFLKTRCKEIYLPLLKWLRLMVSREFHISSVLQIWDSIFASESPLAGSGKIYEGKGYTKQIESPLGLLDFIATSMLLLLKDDCK